MNAHDDLSHQLCRSITTQQPTAVALKGARRRRQLRYFGLLVIPVVVAGGVASATGLVTLRSDQQTSATTLALRAEGLTRSLPACQRAPEGGGLLVEGRVPSEVLAALPAMNGQQTRALPSAVRTFLRQTPERTLRRSVLTADFGRAGRVLAFVSQGPGLASLTDPAACGAVRLRALNRLALGVDNQIARAARDVLASMADTKPGTQSLSLVRFTANGLEAGIAARELSPGRAVSAGVLGAGGGSSSVIYSGIAAPRVAEIVLEAGGGRRLATGPARDGLFAVRLPRGQRPLYLSQRARNGHLLFRQRLRR